MLYKSLSLERLGVEFNLTFYSNIIMIGGDSDTGRTFLYQAFCDSSVFNDKIKCINEFVVDSDEELQLKIESYFGKLIVIDNADILLNNLQKSRIAMDDRNQYVIFGRNSRGCHLMKNGYAELAIQGKSGRLIYPFM